MARTLPLIALCAVLVWPVPADAATTIGELDPASSPSGSCVGGSSFVQAAEVGGASFVVPAGGGVITSWSHKASATAGRELGLRAWRPTATPLTYTLVGGAALETLTASAINTFAVRIPVAAGDLLGLRVGNPGGLSASCEFTAAIGDTVGTALASSEPAVGGSGLFVTAPANRLNVTAVIEPDADQDGYGDESQDGCPSDAATTGSCNSSTGGPPGSPGGGTPGASPAKDVLAPRAKLHARRQAIRQGRVRVVVIPNEHAKATVSGRLPIPRASRTHRPRKVTRTIGAHKRFVVRLHFPKRVRRAVRLAMRAGHRPRMRLTVRLVDGAGNVGIVRGTLRLKR